MDLFEAITSDAPVWIDGVGFHGLNYGADYSRINGGRRKVGLVGKEMSYLSLTPEKSFPKTIYFQAREPFMALTEASHVQDLRTVKIELTLEEAVAELQKKGVSFTK